MDTITIVIKGRGAIVVSGKENRARRAYRASGLEVYTLGRVLDHDMVRNLALNYAISIHIPAKNVRVWECECEKPTKKVDVNPNQLELFKDA